MIVTLRLFARVREQIGADSIMLAVADDGVVADVRHELGRMYPALAGLIERSAFAIHDLFADDSCSIPAGAEIAMLPPVSGG